MKQAKAEQLRVAYIDRVPTDTFLYVYVENLNEAMLVIDVLTRRDLNDDRITDNSIGLEVFEDGDWIEWENEDAENIDCVMESYKSKVNQI